MTMENRTTGTTGTTTGIRSKRTKTRALLLASATALAAWTTACSSAAGGEAEEKPVTEEGKTPVTVSVVEDSRFLQEAEAAFEAEHPDIDVQIQPYIAAPEGGGGRVMVGDERRNDADVEKYRTTVSTELMAGKGADLIAVETLAYEKFASRGMFADLSKLMANDAAFKPEDYRQNIFDAVKVGGAQAALPIRFGLEVILANRPVLEQAGIQIDEKAWGVSDLLAAGRKAVETQGGAVQAILAGTTAADVLGDVVQTQFDDFVDAEAKTASFDSESFVSLMKELKALEEEGLIVASEETAMQGFDVFKKMNFQRPMDLLLMPQIVYGGQGAVYSAPGSGGEGIAFDSDFLLAVNERSQVKEEAWLFLKFLLSPERQAHPMLGGYPVHKAALTEQLKAVVEMMSNGRMRIQGPNGATPKAPEEADFAKVDALVERAGVYAGSDPQIVGIVREEAASFFEGGATAEAAAELIQNRVTTYLNE